MVKSKRDPRDAVVTGYDAMTPLAFTLEGSFEAAVEGGSGVRWTGRFDPDEDFPVKVSGEIPDAHYGDFPFYNERDQANWFSPVIFSSLAVVHRALAHAGLDARGHNPARTAVLFSSAIGGLDAMIDAEKRLSQGRSPHPFTNPNGCLNLVAGKVSMLSGATGPCFCPVASCATGNVSIALGAHFIRSGMCDFAICGASDFPVLPSLLASFASMNGAFQSHRPDDRAFENPAMASRPFSRDRKGFVVSEGAAAVILAARECAESASLVNRGIVRGIGMNGDAHHYVKPHQPTVEQCMRLALKDAGIGPSDLDYVSAHAASTRAGDLVEAKALNTVFGSSSSVPVGALKSQIGHTMGASSAIEAVMALLGMGKKLALPTINLDPDPDINLNHVTDTAAQIDQKFVLSNSFGFGGTNCCLVFEREEA